jgi:hypothetical protein
MGGYGSGRPGSRAKTELKLWMATPTGRASALAGITSRRASLPCRNRTPVRFTFDRPYDVDSQKFASRFWKDATRFETGAGDCSVIRIGSVAGATVGLKSDPVYREPLLRIQ